MTLSEDEIKLLRYEVYFIWRAAQKVRTAPAEAIRVNLDALDDLIKALDERTRGYPCEWDNAE